MEWRRRAPHRPRFITTAGSGPHRCAPTMKNAATTIGIGIGIRAMATPATPGRTSWTSRAGGCGKTSTRSRSIRRAECLASRRTRPSRRPASVCMAMSRPTATTRLRRRRRTRRWPPTPTPTEKSSSWRRAAATRTTKAARVRKSEIFFTARKAGSKSAVTRGRRFVGGRRNRLPNPRSPSANAPATGRTSSRPCARGRMTSCTATSTTGTCPRHSVTSQTFRIASDVR